MKVKVAYLLISLVSVILLITGCSMDAETIQETIRGWGDVFNLDNASIDLPVEEAYPGQKGELKTGYLNGEAIEFEVINGEYIYEGDIVLSPDEISLAPARGAGRTKGKWPNRAVPYEIHSSFTNPQRALDAVAAYNRLGFNFFPRNGQSAYVRFIRSTTGNSSSVGRTGKCQNIKITDGASVGTVIHEMGHALGLWHEHTRASRDQVVQINWDNIVDGKEHNFRTYTQRGKDGFDHLGFDFSSIMLYHSFAFAVDSSQPTISRLNGTTFGSQRDGLSAGDISTLYAMYPHNGTTWTSVVSRDSNKLDVFRATGDGSISTSAWDQNVSGGAWRGWWTIRNGVTAPGGQVTSVSRDANKLDVFTVGTNSRIYTAAWDQNVSNGAWRGWWTIGSLVAQVGSHVSVVSRHRNKLDVFAIGNDGGVYTAAWDQNVSSGKWRGWWRVRNGVAACGGEVVAVSRDSNKLDIFTVGTDGNVWTAAWDQNVSSGKWRGWWSLGSTGQAVAKVSAVHSASNRLHVYAVRLDGRIYSNEWDGSKGGWTGWRWVAGGIAVPGCKVVPVSRAAGKVDLFVIGLDHSVYTAAWETGRDSRNVYRGWWRIGTRIAPGTQLCAVARDANKLDVFAIATNGRVYTAAWDAYVSNGQWRGWWLVP